MATLAGSPRAARQVGYALASLSPTDTDHIPWWRVVNKNGYLSIRGHEVPAKDIQRDLLQQEGIIVDENYKLDLQTYAWSGD